jgi:hypothetical protein
MWLRAFTMCAALTSLCLLASGAPAQTKLPRLVSGKPIWDSAATFPPFDSVVPSTAACALALKEECPDAIIASAPTVIALILYTNTSQAVGADGTAALGRSVS